MTLDLNPYLEKIKKDNFCREIRNEIVEAFEKIDETINNNNMQDLNDFQKKEDKTLDTDDKKVIGAINEVYSKCQAIEESLESLELPLTTSKVISKNLINTTMFENLSVDEFFENYESGNLIIPVIEETFEIGQAYNTEVLFTDGTSDASGDFFFQFQKNGTTVFSRYTLNLTDTIDSAKLIFNKTSFLANHAGKIFSHIQVCKKASGQSYPTYEQYAEKKDYTTFVRSSDLEKLQLQNLSPFFYPKKVKIVAHRGGESKYTENSIGAFIEGCKDGYDFIETDIWQTSDGELICMHDQTLDRTSNATGDVMQMTLSEIQEKKLKDGSTIPTLKEFLLICKKYGKVPVIEIKNINQDWNKLSQELSYVAMEDSAIILCASIDNLNSIRKVLPRVHCSYLMYETDSITKEILNELKNISNTSLNTNCNLTEADIKLCHQYNVLIGKWTIDDVDVANNLIDIEIDFITTNNSNILSRDTYSRKEIDTQFENIAKQIEQGGTGGNSDNAFAVNLNHYNIGKIIDAPTNYTSHPFNCIRYDKELEKLIVIFNAQISHYDRGNAYIATMDRTTFEVSKLNQIIATDSKNNSYDIKSCVYSFVIDDNGDYIIFDSTDNLTSRRFISTDKGTTWTYTGEFSKWCSMIYVMDDGTWLSSPENQSQGGSYIFKSTDKGITWNIINMNSPNNRIPFETGFFDCGNNKIIAISRAHMNALYDTTIYEGKNTQPPMISFSSDGGNTWTDYKESISIPSACADNVTGYVKDGIVYLWYADRRLTKGKEGGIYFTYATIENALKDNFATPVLVKLGNLSIVDSDKTNGNAYQDWGAIWAINVENEAYIIYYDAEIDSTSSNKNYHLIFATENNIQNENSGINKFLPYSGQYVERLINNLKVTLLEKINSISSGGSGGNVEVGYASDNLVCNWHLGNLDLWDKTDMSLADSINGNKIYAMGNRMSYANNPPSELTYDDTAHTITNNICTTKKLSEMGVLSTNGFSMEAFYYTDNMSKAFSYAKDTLKENYGGGGCILFGQYGGYAFPVLSSGSVDYTKIKGEAKGLTANQFNHQVLTYSESEIKIYINGTLKNTFNISSYPDYDKFEISDLLNFYLSCQSASALTPKTIRIYNKILNLEEIDKNYKYEQSILV